jgi:hypothetical protein
MMRKLCVVALLACATSVHASSFGVIPQAGLAGYGATVQWGFSPYLAVTAGFTGGDFSIRDVKTDNATYDGDIRLRNPQALVNWAPFGGHFRVSGGLVASDSGFDLVATEIKNRPDVDRVEVSADYKNSVVPIFTVGFESPLQQKGFGYHLSAGVIYAGEPSKISFTCSFQGGSVFSDSCTEFADEERRKIEDDLKKFQFLPVLQAGLIFRM